jgi:hypothetical protein
VARSGDVIRRKVRFVGITRRRPTSPKTAAGSSPVGYFTDHQEKTNHGFMYWYGLDEANARACGAGTDDDARARDLRELATDMGHNPQPLTTRPATPPPNAARTCGSG